ncbi:hypothetical protein ACSQ67_010197 [Phaseolus vulgaris]
MANMLIRIEQHMCRAYGFMPSRRIRETSLIIEEGKTVFGDIGGVVCETGAGTVKCYEKEQEDPRTQRNGGLRFGWNPKKSVTRTREDRNRGGSDGAALVCSSGVGRSGPSGLEGNVNGSRGVEVTQLIVDLERVLCRHGEGFLYQRHIVYRSKLEEGSLGASLCDSVGSKFDVAEGGRVTVDGGGRVEATGGGRAGNGGPVQGKMDSTPLGKALRMWSQHEMQNWLFPIRACRRMKGEEGVSVLVNESIDEREHDGRGPASCVKDIKDGYPFIGCVERSAVSGKEVSWVVNKEHFSQRNEFKEVSGKAKLTCHRRNTVYEASSDEIILDHAGSLSCVGDSLRPGSPLEELEQVGVRVDKEGDGARRIPKQL